MTNLLDQNDVMHFGDEELEDLQKMTDEEFFDLVEQLEKQEKTNALIKKIIEEKQNANNNIK